MDSDDLHTVAVEAAIAGANAIRAMAAEDFATQGKGGIEDFVTAADIASEQAIIQVLKGRRPQDSIVAEETGIYPGSGSIRWYVDPLDGTANIVAGSPDYAVSISAHRGEQTLAAVIYRPADHQWLATSADEAIQGSIVPDLSLPRPLDEARITVSRPHDPVQRDEAMALRAALLPHVADEQRVGSAACALLRVITGGVDAYVSVNLPLWDTAAGHCLVERAGGAIVRLRTKTGTPICVAGGPSVTKDLAEIMLGLA